MSAEEPPVWRTLPAVTVLREVRDVWAMACNVLRTQLGQGGAAHPSWSAIMGAAAQVILSAPELRIPAQYEADVLAGHARCWYPLAKGGHAFVIPATNAKLRVCGSFAKLERHHRINRSLGGGDSDLIWLCHDHHGWITNRHEGRGWEWLSDALGYAREAADGHKQAHAMSSTFYLARYCTCGAAWRAHVNSDAARQLLAHWQALHSGRGHRPCSASVAAQAHPMVESP